MALTAPGIVRAILQAGPEIQGPLWPTLASVVGVGVSSWAVTPGNIQVRGVATGVMGGGQVLGSLVVAPQPATLLSAAIGQGFEGVFTPSMVQTIGVGVANAFTSDAQYLGVSSGVGAGTDVSKVVATNQATLAMALQLVATGQGLLGVHIPPLVLALSTGIASMLLTGSGTGVVTGSAGPFPAAGTSSSRVF